MSGCIVGVISKSPVNQPRQSMARRGGTLKMLVAVLGSGAATAQPS
jgi:hypothetical protein